MSEDEAREIVRRELQDWGGPDGLRGSMLADDIREAAREWMDATLNVLHDVVREAAQTRSYPGYFTDLPEPPNWAEIIARRIGPGRLSMNDNRDPFICAIMETLVYGSRTARFDEPPVMKIRPAARIVAEVLTAAGIEITGRQIEAVYRKSGERVG